MIWCDPGVLQTRRLQNSTMPQVWKTAAALHATNKLQVLERTYQVGLVSLAGVWLAPGRVSRGLFLSRPHLRLDLHVQRVANLLGDCFCCDELEVQNTSGVQIMYNPP